MMSNSYLDETLAFIVPDESREQFATWAEIRAAGALKIAVPNLPYYIEKLQLLVPAATIEPVADVVAVMKSKPADVDAIALPAERGSAWTLIYPAFSVIVPEPGTRQNPVELSDRPPRSGVRRVHQYVDRPEKEGRNARLAVSVLDSRSVRHRPLEALVNHPGRSSLGRLDRRRGPWIVVRVSPTRRYLF